MLTHFFICLLTLPAMGLLGTRPHMGLSAMYPPRRVHARNVRMGAADGACNIGDILAPATLDALAVRGSRAVVLYINDDGNFLCSKALRACADRAGAFEAKGATVVAVRPPSGAAEGSTKRYPAISFYVDAEDEVRQRSGLPLKAGFRGRPRRSYVLSANGTVCGIVSEAVDPSEHAACVSWSRTREPQVLSSPHLLPFDPACGRYALRFLEALEVEERAAADAGRVSSSGKALAFQLQQEQQVQAQAQASERAARTVSDKAMRLRANAMFVEAKNQARMSAGRLTFVEAIGALARQARQRVEGARVAAAAATTAVAREAAYSDEVEWREDEVSALRMEVDAMEERSAVRAAGSEHTPPSSVKARRSFVYRLLSRIRLHGMTGTGGSGEAG